MAVFKRKNSATITTSGENMNQLVAAEVYKTVAHYIFPFFKGKDSIFMLFFMKEKTEM
jgi:hypothetical protein